MPLKPQNVFPKLKEILFYNHRITIIVRKFNVVAILLCLSGQLTKHSILSVDPIMSFIAIFSLPVQETVQIMYCV